MIQYLPSSKGKKITHTPIKGRSMCLCLLIVVNRMTVANIGILLETTNIKSKKHMLPLRAGPVFVFATSS